MESAKTQQSSQFTLVRRMKIMNKYKTQAYSVYNETQAIQTITKLHKNPASTARAQRCHHKFKRYQQVITRST